MPHIDPHWGRPSGTYGSRILPLTLSRIDIAWRQWSRIQSAGPFFPLYCFSGSWVDAPRMQSSDIFLVFTVLFFSDCRPRRHANRDAIHSVADENNGWQETNINKQIQTCIVAVAAECFRCPFFVLTPPRHRIGTRRWNSELQRDFVPIASSFVMYYPAFRVTLIPPLLYWICCFRWSNSWYIPLFLTGTGLSVRCCICIDSVRPALFSFLSSYWQGRRRYHGDIYGLVIQCLRLFHFLSSIESGSNTAQ